MSFEELEAHLFLYVELINFHINISKIVRKNNCKKGNFYCTTVIQALENYRKPFHNLSFHHVAENKSHFLFSVLSLSQFFFSCIHFSLHSWRGYRCCHSVGTTPELLSTVWAMVSGMECESHMACNREYCVASRWRGLPRFSPWSVSPYSSRYGGLTKQPG